MVVERFDVWEETGGPAAIAGLAWIAEVPAIF
jgi:hypothetical protein